MSNSIGVTDPNPVLPTAWQRATGSTGNALQDGPVRAAIAVLMNLSLAFIVTLTSTLTAEQVAILYAAVNPALILAFGFFDWYRKR